MPTPSTTAGTTIGSRKIVRSRPGKGSAFDAQPEGRQRAENASRAASRRSR